MSSKRGVGRENLWTFGLRFVPVLALLALLSLKIAPLLSNVRPEVVERPQSVPQTLKLNGPAPQFHNEIDPLSGQTGECC